MSQKGRTKVYKILDNGGYPFIAEVTASRIQVFRQRYDEATDDYTPTKKLLDLAYDRLFVGDNAASQKNYAPKGMWPGNSLLVKTGDEYIYVGSDIYSFKARDGEEITHYYSPVGDSQVPYPYAVGKEYVYFMLDRKTVSKALLDPKVDAYGQFYGWTVKDEALKREIDKSKKVFRSKTIHKMTFGL